MSDHSNKLPAAWTKLPIEKLFAPLEDGRVMHQGWSPQCEKEPSPSEAQWGVLRTTSIQAGEFQPEHNKLLPGKLDPRPLLEVKPGDILLTCAGPRNRCGISCLVRNTRSRLMISGKMYRFRAKPDAIESGFLESFLQTEEAKQAIDRMKTGGSDSGLNLTHERFRQLPVPVAPLPEQRRIVAEIEKQFTRLEAGVAALRRVQANLKRYRAAVLKAACEGRLVPTEAELHRKLKTKDSKLETGVQLLTRILTERRQNWQGHGKYKEPSAPDTANLPPPPEGWTWASVDQLLIEPLCNGVSIKGSDEPPGVRALRLSAMSDSGFDYSDARYLPLSDSDVDDLWIQEDDFFMSRGNGSLHLVGRGTSAQKPPSPTIFPDTMIRLRLAHTIRTSGWVRRLWPSRLIRSQIETRVKTTAGIYKIAQPQVEGMAIPLPPPAEQTRIVAEVERRLSVVEELESVVTANLQRATRLRQSILQKAFTGEL